MFDHLKKQFSDELDEIRGSGMYKEEKLLNGRQGAEIKVGGKSLINFCSNNYLGLAGSDELVEESKKALDQYGFGMSSVRFICGTGEVHKELEKAVSKFFGTDDTILYTSCFDANTGLFETLLSAGDAVFSDQLNHASIIDGIRLCKADRFRYEHSNMEDLEEKLKEAGNRRRKLIVTDGVFSMDGDVACLKEICDLGDKYEAIVMVDDSHATGVLGLTGRGSIEATGVISRVDIVTSTFGKALGGATGGFTTGRGSIIEYLRQRSRPYLFSNTMPNVVAHTSLYVVKNFDSSFANLLKKLSENTKYFREKMTSLGFTLSGISKTGEEATPHPITPVMLMDEKLTMRMADELFEQSIYVRGFTYPVVPKEKARIRVQISAAHTGEHLERALRAFESVGKKLAIIK